MQNSIPIRVTSKLQPEIIFGNAATSLLQHIRNKRHPTAPKLRANFVQKHQTIDIDSNSTRTRRISSSAASKRFPRDFFKDEACLNPIKSNRPQHKKYQPIMRDTFSRKTFVEAQGDYLLQEDDKVVSDTPKFKQRKVTKQAQANEKVCNVFKVQQICTPVHQKYNTCPEVEGKTPLGPINQFEIYDKNVQPGQPLISNFNLTLGMKNTLMGLLQKGNKFKKKQEVQEKENNNWKLGKIENSKREGSHKVDGFRIRRKVIA